MATLSHFRYLDYDDTYKAGSNVNILKLLVNLFCIQGDCRALLRCQGTAKNVLI